MVKRYDLPGVHAINFVLEASLGMSVDSMIEYCTQVSPGIAPIIVIIIFCKAFSILVRGVQPNSESFELLLFLAFL